MSGAIKDRPRNGENGECRCGFKFQKVAVKWDGTKIYFWCSRCDLVRGLL